MALVRNFTASTSLANQIEVSWLQPLAFGEANDEVVVTRTITYYPMELFNTDFPTKATDPVPVEIFRGKVITGLNTGSISVSGNTLTDSAATFPVTSPMNGRIFRDSDSKIFRVISNTATTVTLDGPPANGKYIILADFPLVDRSQQNFENDIRTVSSVGNITGLVELVNGSLSVSNFAEDELVNLVFKDASNARYFIKSNTSDTITFFDSTATVVVGSGMAILSKFSGAQPKPYIDNYKSSVEAADRIGTGLQDSQFYYYTGFTIPVGANVAQAEFSIINSGVSTQSAAISIRNREWGTKLYNYWPSLFRDMDSNADLEDLMKVFGYQFGELYSIIETYKLQDTHTVFASAALALAEQTGLPTVNFSIGVDTLRRIGAEMLTAWKLKGSKEGIALFIKIIAAWDITGGTGDVGNAIIDVLPNVSALRFYDASLGTTNTRLTATSPAFVPGGRFVRGLPGVVIPGFFTFREFVITVPSVALYVGNSSSFSSATNSTIMVDTSANYGASNSLVGNYLLPNQEEINDIFLITANTGNSITVQGVINNKTIGGHYAVLSPLNASRFLILNKLLPFYIPFGTKQGFTFT